MENRAGPVVCLDDHGVDLAPARQDHGLVGEPSNSKDIDHGRSDLAFLSWGWICDVIAFHQAIRPRWEYYRLDAHHRCDMSSFLASRRSLREVFVGFRVVDLVALHVVDLGMVAPSQLPDD